MNAAPFDLFGPSAGETPVVVEVPHASIVLDPESMAWCVAPAHAIAQDADLYVDELVHDAPCQGASMIVARRSRYVLDLNRDATDVDCDAVQGATLRNRPCSLLWWASTRGQRALSHPVPPSELDRRLALLYHPYHEALRDIVERKRSRFGVAVLLSAHSMPGPGPDASSSAGARADVVTGTQGGTTAHRGLLVLVDQHARSFGWRVAQDDPYPGGATTRRYGAPDGGVHAIQVEMARRLYMDERSLGRKAEGFKLAQSFWRGLVAKLGTAALG